MRLWACYIEPLAYVAYTLKRLDDKCPDYDSLRNDVLHLLEQGQRKIDSGDCSPGDAIEARFAICAWIDEAIMQSRWPHKSQWRKNLLQTHFFKTTEAGFDFFERLTRLQNDRSQVKEVYYLCLNLGFTGKYSSDKVDMGLDRIKASLSQSLTGTSGGIYAVSGKALFPDAYQQPRENMRRSKKPRLSFSAGFAAAWALPPGLLMLMYFLFSYILNRQPVA